MKTHKKTEYIRKRTQNLDVKYRRSNVKTCCNFSNIIFLWIILKSHTMHPNHTNFTQFLGSLSHTCANPPNTPKIICLVMYLFRWLTIGSLIFAVFNMEIYLYIQSIEILSKASTVERIQ